VLLIEAERFWLIDYALFCVHSYDRSRNDTNDPVLLGCFTKDVLVCYIDRSFDCCSRYQFKVRLSIGISLILPSFTSF
jgi:hypothetical protein